MRCLHGLRSPLAPAALAVFLWLLISTLVYWSVGNSSTVKEFDSNNEIVEKYYCHWTVAQSFYYAVQAGLSVGFGLLTETKEGSRLFTVFHVLAGSSFIIGALVFFIQISITRQVAWQAEEERRLVDLSSRAKAEGYGAFSPQELRDLLMCHPEHMRDMLTRMESDDKVVCKRMQAFVRMDLQSCAAMVDEVLKEAGGKLEEFKDHALSTTDFTSSRQKMPQRCCRFLSAHKDILKQITATVCWVIVGMIYICVREETSFITALYFAVTSLSTGGFYAVTSTASGYVYWFVGIYCLIGVPLYGLLLGSYANILVEQGSAEQVVASVHTRTCGAEAALLQHLAKAERKEKVDFANYVEIQLLRLGKVDRHLLRELRANFNRLDTGAEGRVVAEDFLTESQQRCVEYEKKNGATATASPQAGASEQVLEEQAQQEEV